MTTPKKEKPASQDEKNRKASETTEKNDAQGAQPGDGRPSKGDVYGR